MFAYCPLLNTIKQYCLIVPALICQLTTIIITPGLGRWAPPRTLSVPAAIRCRRLKYDHSQASNRREIGSHFNGLVPWT
jgi:hypothetical protein